MGLFIKLFQLEEELSRKASVQVSLEDGLNILKEAADVMKDIERNVYFVQGEGVHKAPISHLQNLQGTRLKCYIRHLRN